MNLSSAIRTIRTLGPGTALGRIIQALKVRSGYIERIDPARPFGVAELSQHFRSGESIATALDRFKSTRFGFFYHPDDNVPRRDAIASLVSRSEIAELLARTEALSNGVVRFFSRTPYELGDPIDWHLNPANGVRWPNDRHWSGCSQLDARMGDIKYVWEANRFGFLFDLVRAHTLTGDAQWIELGLALIESWIDANPPAKGPNWVCGQETSFRLMAWCFFLRAAAPTLEVSRFATIAASIYRQTQRVERYIGFARSIRNNHSFSEAIGLYTIGLLFPGFDCAARWRAKGKKILVAEASYQIFDDGSYIQHSMNYHRLMLSDCLWAIRLGNLQGDTFPDAFTQQLEKATIFLRDMVDAKTGRVPNYGANDGAQVLPLTSCDYLDYRPIVQSMWTLLKGESLYEQGSWDELRLWMCGMESVDAPKADVAPTSHSYESGGYYVLRGKDSMGMARCHSYRERPSQADMLHFDLWWRGVNVLRDAGSYSYNCEAPWQDYFKSTAAHNTIVVNGENQMTKGPRFMWFDWTKSRSFGRSASADGLRETWKGEHYGYRDRFGITHRRDIACDDDGCWHITDTLDGTGELSAVMSWHLPDMPIEDGDAADRLRMRTPNGMVSIEVQSETGSIEKTEVLRGMSNEKACAGWESLYYGEKSPIHTWRVHLRGALPIRVTTAVRLSGDEAP